MPPPPPTPPPAPPPGSGTIPWLTRRSIAALVLVGTLGAYKIGEPEMPANVVKEPERKSRPAAKGGEAAPRAAEARGVAKVQTSEGRLLAVRVLPGANGGPERMIMCDKFGITYIDPGDPELGVYTVRSNFTLKYAVARRPAFGGGLRAEAQRNCAVAQLRALTCSSAAVRARAFSGWAPAPGSR